MNTSVGIEISYVKNKLDYIKEISKYKGRDDFFSSLSKVPLFNYLVMDIMLFLVWYLFKS